MGAGFSVHSVGADGHYWAMALFLKQSAMTRNAPNHALQSTASPLFVRTSREFESACCASPASLRPLLSSGSLGGFTHHDIAHHMHLKTVTLIAIIGQILELVYWQSFRFFHFPIVFGEPVLSALNLLVAIIGQGSLILFLITLYSKQK